MIEFRIQLHQWISFNYWAINIRSNSLIVKITKPQSEISRENSIFVGKPLVNVHGILSSVRWEWVETACSLIRNAAPVKRTVNKALLFTTSVIGTYSEKALTTNKNSVFFPTWINYLAVLSILTTSCALFFSLLSSSCNLSFGVCEHTQW